MKIGGKIELIYFSLYLTVFYYWNCHKWKFTVVVYVEVCRVVRHPCPAATNCYLKLSEVLYSYKSCRNTYQLTGKMHIECTTNRQRWKKWKRTMVFRIVFLSLISVRTTFVNSGQKHSVHFGESRQQVTLHTAVLYYETKDADVEQLQYHSAPYPAA